MLVIYFILYIHKSEGIYSNGDITYTLKRDYFQTTSFRSKDEINEEYISKIYSSKLKQFIKQKENMRSKNFFLMINLENDELYISKSKSKLFENLKSNNILENMYSDKNLDFTKKTIFDKYHDSCTNFYLKKMTLSNR